MQIALRNSVHVRDLAHAQCGVGQVLVNVADDFATLPLTEALIVMQASKVIPPKMDDDEATEMIYGGERTKFQSDLTAQFVRALQNSYGVSINQQNIETTLGELVAQ